MESALGSFLFSRLREIGVRHVIGVPGDYNLPLLEQIEEAGLEFVGTCNELNAAYAADGYARINGIAALLTTYGVGELSAINGIAGANAEHVPVVCITGAPPISAMEHHLALHHTSADGNFERTMNVAREFTAAQTRLTPANAAGEIDRVLRECIREKRPVYLQVPSDVSFLTIEVPSTPLDAALPVSDRKRLNGAVEAALAMLSRAERPAMLLDMDAERFNWGTPALAFIQKVKAPFATLSTAKCALDESHPLFVGIYNGRASSAITRELIEGSDCLIALAPRFFDTNSFWFSQALPATTVLVRPYDVTIANDRFEGVTALEFLTELAKRAEVRPVPALAAAPAAPEVPANVRDDNNALTQESFWRRMAGFFRENDVVIAETGTARIGVSGIRMPRGTTCISQGLWGSIGYTLPALLGTLLADDQRRQLLFIGDGSFQCSVQELSTIQRHELRPIIFVIDNHGYTVERLILGLESDHNDVAEWDLGRLLAAFNPTGDAFAARVTTEDELERALVQAEHEQRLTLITVVLDKFDTPAVFKLAAPVLADFQYGPCGPQRLQRAGTTQ